MNADLEKDLQGCADGLLPFAESLKRAPSAHVSSDFADRVMAQVRRREGSARIRTRWLRPAALAAIAASLAAVFALTFVVEQPEQTVGAEVPNLAQSGNPDEERLVACQRADGSFSDSSASRYVQAFAVSALSHGKSSDRTALRNAVDALVRAQDAEGGWGNAALSARNVAALAEAAAAGMDHALPAYRRGLRYLRMHGIVEMSATEFASEAEKALARLGSSQDAGLVCSTALARRL